MNTLIEKQIEKTMKRAFWDLIKSDLNTDPQRFDHLVILIQEIREQIKSFTPNRHDFISELDEVLDDSFLKHLFIEKSLDSSHFFKLIIFLVNKIKAYSSPYLDKEIKIWEENVKETLQKEIVYSEFIPIFFEKLYYFLNMIEKDIKEYYDKCNN